MKLLPAFLFLCPQLYAQDTRIDINDTGLVVNSVVIEKNTAAANLLRALGNPDRNFSKANFIGTYDKGGIRLYFTKPDSAFRTLEIDFKKEFYDFSPSGTFSGHFTIYGTAVSKNSSPIDLLMIPEIHLHSFITNTYVGFTDKFILSVDFSKSRRQINSFAVLFRGEDDSMFTSHAVVTDSAVFRPLPVRHKILNLDTVVTRYVNGKAGEPGYRRWEVTKVQADIIMEGYPEDISREELTPLVTAIMQEKGIDEAEVFSSETAGMLFRMSSLEAARLLKASGGYLGRFKR